MISSTKYGLLLGMMLVATTATAQLPDKEASRVLELVKGSLVFMQQDYQGTDLAAEHLFSGKELRTDSGRWQLSLQVQAVPGQKEAVDIHAGFRLSAGNARAAAVAVALRFGQWSAANYLLVPASVYNGNRYRTIGNGYNPEYPKDMYYNPSVPLTISNNPRLSVEKGKASEIALQTGNMATPAVCFFSPVAKKGVIVLTTQETSWGNNGITLRENASQDSFYIRVSSPAVRKMAPGFGDFHPSGDLAPAWIPGNESVIRLRVYVFDADGIPALLQRFMQVRKDLSPDIALRNQLPMSQLLQMGRDICSSNFFHTPRGNYYKPENNNDFQLGWVSGMINTYPMLAMNTLQERQRVGEELDFVVNNLQGKSGYFFGGIKENGEMIPEKMNPAFPAAQAMVRKNGDVLLWLMKHLLLLKAQGHAAMINPSWEAAAQRLAGAFANTWQQHREFGQYIVPASGEIAVYNSTAGAIAPAGLTLAARYFNKPEWFTIASEAARFYYRRDVAGQGLTGGDCGDISQDANSESAFGFLESLMALYDYSHDPEWLKMAETTAALCATWTMSYAYDFPAGSRLGQLNSNIAGAVWASIQNKHAAPGICTGSGDGLFRLFRATGERRYADLVRDIQHAHTEAVNRPGHITSNYLPGSSMERIQPGDAEGKGSIGEFIHTRNSWTETAGMLMAMELPGVYVQTDKGNVYVFDHLTAGVVRKDGTGMVITLHNPTTYDARVSVMTETSREAKVPLRPAAFHQWPQVQVKAGEKIQLWISRNGKINVR